MNRRTEDPRQTVAARIEEAGLNVRRFVDPETNPSPSPLSLKKGPNEVGEHYGVYLDGGLLVFDVAHDENDADMQALDELPRTFTVRGRDGSEQRYYNATENAMSNILYATFGRDSIDLSWGQIHASTQYVIGPCVCGKRWDGTNSQKHTDCEKSYQIAENREIAELVSEQLLDVLVVDPDYQTGVPQSTIDAYKQQGDADSGIRPYERTEMWAHSPEILAIQVGERRLTRSIRRLHDHPENTDGGVLMWDLLDRAEELGMDRHQTLRAMGSELVDMVAIKPR